MTAKKWKERLIHELTIDAGLVSSFDTSLNILCEVLEERDRIYKAYTEDGQRPTIIFTTDRGKENPKPNPLLTQWKDLNVTALQYLRDLGLTPAGLRKLQGQLQTQQPTGGQLEEFIREYE